MRIPFAKSEAEFAPIIINGKAPGKGYRGGVQCQATWSEHFKRSQMELSRAGNLSQSLGKALLPQAVEEGELCNERTRDVLHHMYPTVIE